eukprot:scaffold6503_cov115-Isochrysis_galbana.AAC.1
MASEVLAEAALLAFYSTAEAVTIVLFGVGARWTGYLDGNINGRLSRFCMRLTNPVLCLSLYSFFSASKLARWWPVPIVATLHIALGALLGRLAGALLRLQPPHRQILVMSVGFANCGAIPFVLVVPLFLQWSRTKDDPQALGDAFSVSGATACGCHSPPCATDTPMLSLDPARSAALPAPPGDPAAIRCAGDWPPYASETHSVTGQELMPGRADPETCSENDVARGSGSRDFLPVSNAPRATSGATGSRGSLRCMRRAADGVWTIADRNLVCILIALGIGCISPLKAELQEGGLRWMGSVWDQLGKTNVVLSTILLGSALQPDARIATHSVVAWFQRWRSCRFYAERRQNLRSAGSAAERRQCKVRSGASARLEAQDVRSSSAAVESGLSAGSRHGAVGSPPVLQSDESPADGLTSSSPQTSQLRLRISVATVLLKLIVMPAICIPLQVRRVGVFEAQRASTVHCRTAPSGPLTNAQLGPCAAGACGSRGRSGGRARLACGAPHDVGPAVLALLGRIATLDGPPGSGRAGWSPVSASVLCGHPDHRSTTRRHTGRQRAGASARCQLALPTRRAAHIAAQCHGVTTESQLVTCYQLV